MRCYNGQPDKEYQAVLDEYAAARRRLKAANPEAHCTYFPMEEKYQVWLHNKPISVWTSNMFVAIDDAIRHLKEGVNCEPHV